MTVAAAAPMADTSSPAGAPFADTATRRQLPDGRRWLLQHGPIDLVVEAWGTNDQVTRAHDAAWDRFQTVLGELVAELTTLRAPISKDDTPSVTGETARRMASACTPHAARFVTPMAAVAGAVADTVLQAMTDNATLARGYVNNGGDIAFHLSPGESLSTGIVGRYDAPALDAFAKLCFDAPSRGLATSGWRGRSQSLGVADAVTVLAETAAAADVAATLIANAVTCDDPAIKRTPASEIAPDSDLGERLVTTDVGPLGPDCVSVALDAGLVVAREMQQAGLIHGAFLLLQEDCRAIAVPAALAEHDDKKGEAVR